MTTLNSAKIKHLNNMNKAAQDVQLGTLLAGGATALPASGTIAPVATVSYKITPALASTSAVHGAITLPASGTTTVTTSITNPDVARQITVTGSGAGVTGTLSLTGTDIAGAALTEDLALNGTSTVISTKAFATITSIVVPARSTGGETVIVGTGAKVGFPVAIPQTTRVLAKNFDGSTDAGTVTAGATAALSVYAAAGTFNAAKILELIYVNY